MLVRHVFFVEYCKDSSCKRGTECISSWCSICPSTYTWVYVVLPSSVVTHVRVRTGDRKPWSVNASVLMLSCWYASFYMYLLSIYRLDASSIVWLNTLISVWGFGLDCLHPRGLLSFSLQQCRSASWGSSVIRDIFWTPCTSSPSLDLFI
jgi:hypothetical protein